MFHNISWQQYILFVAVSLLVYYTVVLFLMYKKSAFSFFNRPGLKANPVNGEDSKYFATVHVLVQQLDDIISRHRGRGESLLPDLQAALIQYPQLAQTAFRQAIHNRINILLHEQGAEPMTEAALNRLWRKDVTDSEQGHV